MAGMVEWAKNELDMLLTGDEENDRMRRVMNNNILQMVGVFSEQGHSGFSAGYALSVLKLLLDWKPIKPLTGEDDEWGPVHDWNKENNTQQNKRCSAVFRDNFDNSTAHYLHGKVFSDDGGKTWYSKGGKNGSSIPVVFPFTVPEKPEYVLESPEEEE